jgi:hypothetical protein
MADADADADDVVAVPVNPIGAVGVELALAVAFRDDANALAVFEIGDDNLIFFFGLSLSSISTMAMLSAVPP